MVQSIGVSFGDTLEQYRDPLLISCSLVLIVVALGYLLLPSVRFTFDSLLAVKVPTTFKRFLGGLLILLPGIFIIATVYFAEVTQALEQRWPGLAARYISKSDAPNRELVARTTSKGETRDQSSIEEAPVPDSGTTTVEAPPAPYPSWDTTPVQSANDPDSALKQKQRARRILVERRLKEQERKKKQRLNIWLTKEGQVAAVSEALLDEAVSYLAANDVASFHQLEATQRVLYLKPRERVSIIKYEYTSGKVKIRILSTNIELWTLRKSLTKG